MVTMTSPALIPALSAGPPLSTSMSSSYTVVSTQPPLTDPDIPPLEETIIRVKGFMLVFQPVDDENFLVLALTRDGNLGKARYLIRRHVHAIRQEF